MSRTDIDLDDDLLAKTMKASGAKTKREAVHVALEEYVKSHAKRRSLSAYAGKFEFYEGFDPVVLRAAREFPH